MFDYIKDYYKVPAELGREILFSGKRKGVIVEDRGQYLGVLFDDSEPHDISTLHPTWEVKYLDTFAKIRKPSKSKQRYMQYLDADSSLSFGEWLKAGYYKRNEFGAMEK